VSTEATTGQAEDRTSGGQAEDRTSGLDQNRFSRHEFSARDVFVMLVCLIAVLERIDHEQLIEAHTQKGDARCRRACEVRDA
jgi:hypothetical protein